MSAVAARPTQRPAALPPEDAARAACYALASRLFAAPADAALLAALAGRPGPDPASPLGTAWRALAEAAAATDARTAREQFDALFVAAGTPPLNPYASLYLAGFLMETPLAALRQELAALGLARLPGVGETEDHLAGLCDAMRALVAERRPLAMQRRFFDAQIAPWAGRCLDDVERAAGAGFVGAAAAFVRAFLDIERDAFALEDDDEES